MTYAILSGSGADNAVAGHVRIAGSATSITSRSNPSSRQRSSAVLSTTVGAASVSMNAIRASGTAGSIGRYAAPVLSTAKIAVIAWAERSTNNPTTSPAPTP
ncbi:hypothetical protein MSIMFI_05427 [Mycobacterium simulans]|nr:hypothetical protein MSIMFI_05427 [Mycobacterium simulans]